MSALPWGNAQRKNPAARAGQNQVNFDKENPVQEVKNMKDGEKVR